MKRVGLFEKVSFEQFKKDVRSLTGCDDKADYALLQSYEGISLPTRATKGSAGYDISTPQSFVLHPGESIIIPTGIRVKIKPGWVLMCFPRSGLGFKYRCQLDNTVGIIDEDYYSSKNEGHIMLKLTNDSKEGTILEVNEGDRIAQALFMPYGITYDDHANGERDGGFGSTGK